MCALAKYLNLECSVRLDHCERVQKGERVVFLSFSREFNVLVQGIEVVREFLSVAFFELAMGVIYIAKPPQRGWGAVSIALCSRSSM